MINQDHLMNKINKISHPIPTKNLDNTHKGIKKIFNTTLIITQKKTNTKIHKLNPYQIRSQIQKLTHTSTENPSKRIPGNQPNIYDINIQRHEPKKGLHISNTLKCNLNSQYKMNKSFLVKTIKAILKTPIQEFEKPIFSFRRTHEAAVRNIKIIAAFNGDLGASIAAQKDRTLNYRSEFRNTAALKNILL